MDREKNKTEKGDSSGCNVVLVQFWLQRGSGSVLVATWFWFSSGSVLVQFWFSSGSVLVARVNANTQPGQKFIIDHSCPLQTLKHDWRKLMNFFSPLLRSVLEHRGKGVITTK